MGAPSWTLNNAVTNGAATASQTAPGTALAVRLRQLIVSIAAGATAQTPLTWVVRDGPTSTGTIIAEGVLAAPANGWAAAMMPGLDLRSTPGNAITIEFTGASAAAVIESVSGQGDFVPIGWPMFQS